MLTLKDEVMKIAKARRDSGEEFLQTIKEQLEALTEMDEKFLTNRGFKIQRDVSEQYDISRQELADLAKKYRLGLARIGDYIGALPHDLVVKVAEYELRSDSWESRELRW